jgi:hypothetical protein
MIPPPRTIKDQILWTLGYCQAVKGEFMHKIDLFPAELDYLVFIHGYCKDNFYFSIPHYNRIHASNRTLAYRMNLKLIELGYIEPHTPARFNSASLVYTRDKKTKKVRKRSARGQLFVTTLKCERLLDDYLKAFQKVWLKYG